MPITKHAIALSVAFLLFGPYALAQKSPAVLRIACDGANVNAEVTINGEFKGECPIDIPVAGGSIQLRVSKKVDESQERVFEQTIRMAAGTVKTIEVALGSPTVNLAWKKSIEDVEEAQALRKEEAQRRALPALLKAAEGGDAAAMFRLGRVHEWGLAGPVDFKQAAIWFGRSADAGNPAGMSAYFTYLFLGRGGVVKDPVRSKSLLDQAAARGDAEAMKILGDIYGWGDEQLGITRDEDLEKKYYEKAAQAGNYMAMLSLSIIFSRAGNAKSKDEWDKKHSTRLLPEAAEGDPKAMSRIASLFGWQENGDEIDLAAITKFGYLNLRYHQKAAASGELNEILTLANMYDEGKYGAPKDKARAVKLARQAAATGDKYANTYLQKLLAK